MFIEKRKNPDPRDTREPLLRFVFLYSEDETKALGAAKKYEGCAEVTADSLEKFETEWDMDTCVGRVVRTSLSGHPIEFKQV